eukprot:6318752-Lingulodinium_polyedra.AAC.1
MGEGMRKGGGFLLELFFRGFGALRIGPTSDPARGVDAKGWFADQVHGRRVATDGSSVVVKGLHVKGLAHQHVSGELTLLHSSERDFSKWVSWSPCLSTSQGGFSDDVRRLLACRRGQVWPDLPIDFCHAIELRLLLLNRRKGCLWNVDPELCSDFFHRLKLQCDGRFEECCRVILQRLFHGFWLSQKHVTKATEAQGGRRVNLHMRVRYEATALRLHRCKRSLRATEQGGTSRAAEVVFPTRKEASWLDEVTAHVQIIYTEQVLASEIRHEEPEAAKRAWVPRKTCFHDFQGRHARIILEQTKLAGRRFIRSGPHTFLDLAAGSV